MRVKLALFALIVLVLRPVCLAADDPAARPNRLLQFTASLDRPHSAGLTALTFAVYREQEGGTPLWSETQTIEADENGQFTVVLGAKEAIPLEIFSSAEARWLGIQQFPKVEEPRILLAAVPYALKAADADTLGGKPLSAFVLADDRSEPGDRTASRDGDEARRRRSMIASPSMFISPSFRGPVTNAVATVGFYLASISGNTSVGFAADGGAWKVYVNASSTPNFDTANVTMQLNDTQMTVFPGVFGGAAAHSYYGVEGLGYDAGVFGRSAQVGVLGRSTASGTGVRGESTGGTGVFGEGETGVIGEGSDQGVYGFSESHVVDSTSFGGYFESVVTAEASNIGVYGRGGEVGVRGHAENQSGTSIGGEFDGGISGATNYGVSATGDEIGVYGVATALATSGLGVYGHGGDTAVVNVGVLGIAEEWGVRGINNGTGGAALGGRAPGGGDLILMHGTNTSDPEFRVTNSGNVQADGTFTTPAADVAERIDTTETLLPGDVVEIDPDVAGHYRLSRTSRSALVAGVVSTQPGVTLNDRTLGDDPNDQRPPLALAGQVPVKVTAENGAIHPGDLLVASSTHGHAMRADANPAAGTVVGKALGVLESGAGTIRMLVMLR